MVPLAQSSSQFFHHASAILAPGLTNQDNVPGAAIEDGANAQPKIRTGSETRASPRVNWAR